MGVHYSRAAEGKEFVLTEAGKLDGRIANKFEDGYISSVSAQYKTCVPTKWLTEGWVEEVDCKKEE